MSSARSNPVILIGAPRSGTKVLRDTIASFPDHTTWPCDEIPAIWKHGNLDSPHDEIGTEDARPEVKEFIRSEFRKRALHDDAEVVVEKTCANALRVLFVDAVLPDARFVHIVRDGRDAVPSAMKRWTGDTTFSYTLRKARFVPVTDVPHYALSFARNRIHRLFSDDDRVQVWGPRFDGIEDVSCEGSLLKTCAMQWAKCVEEATSDLRGLDEDRVETIYYEDFVNSTEKTIENLSSFLDVELAQDEIRKLAAPVHGGSVGKGRDELDENELKNIVPILEDALAHHDYH